MNETNMGSHVSVGGEPEAKEQKISVLQRQETKSQTYDERMTMEFEHELGTPSSTSELVTQSPGGVLVCFYFVYILFSLLVLPSLGA